MPPTPSAETAVHSYFSDVRTVQATGAGVAETSYYPALFALLGGIGATLKPRVHAINHLSNLGAGIPDGGFFDATQLQHSDQDAVRGQLPSRGALEVKSPAEQVADIATGQQVAGYLDLYGLVLVTNLRAFALYTRENGQPKVLEHLELAPSAAAFTALLGNEAERAAQAAPLVEFLTRALQAKAPLTTPEGVAWFLASYAREAKHRLNLTPLTALAPLKASLSEALDLNFTGEQGERFFRATLIQTLWYGLFSAWVLHSEQHPEVPFSWRAAAWELHLPVMQRLFGDLANPAAQHSLNLTDLLDRTAATLARVDYPTFAGKFQGDAVQYFYEPFLAAYDPELRKQFGVWYTPPEVVQYMVERVDQALKTQLDLPLGLADPSVYVLDPATGTGSYLTAALDRIWRTLRDQPDFDDATLDDLRTAVKERLIGFEIMPAPYVIAHMRLTQQLAHYGVTLRPVDPQHPERPERAAVYLTNALTNWHDAPPRLDMPELQAEQDAAQDVKKHKPILVIMGNPPYSAFAGTSQEEEGGLVDKYKEGLTTVWGIGRYNLDELYTRFYRIAERKIRETGCGIVSLITPSSYLNDPSFVVMRSIFVKEFNYLAFDNLNGDSRETGKRTPEGLPDPSVFSTRNNRLGIRSGVAISLLIKKRTSSRESIIKYRDFWGKGKLKALLRALDGEEPEYTVTSPGDHNRFRFKPEEIREDYKRWPRVNDLSSQMPLNGLMEKRAGGLIDFSQSELEGKMRPYFNREVTWVEYQGMNSGLSKDAGRYDAKLTRDRLINYGFSELNIVHYFARPFDERYAYYSSHRPLWNEPRPVLWAQRLNNSFFVTRPASAVAKEGVPFFYTTKLGDNDALKGHAYYIPITWRTQIDDSDGLFASPRPTIRANISTRARAYLTALGAPDPDGSPDAAALIWRHALAVGFSSAYLEGNTDGIANDWPRIPLPATLSALQDSAALGARVAQLLDDTNAPTAPALGMVGRLKRVAEDTQGYEVRAGWGALQRGNVVMPGHGRTVERAADGLPPELGDRVLDVALNDAWVWENVPVAVWGYTVGGYQVMKKWLSYREFSVLGRALTLDEVREVSRMARRLAELVLLETRLNASYERVRADVWDWPVAEV